jgi:hypothetical protein
MADLAKLCKGTQKQWPDGKPFTLVIHDPDSADMRYAIEKLFGVEGPDVKPLLARVEGQLAAGTSVFPLDKLDLLTPV